jgi:transposase-like protein
MPECKNCKSENVAKSGKVRGKQRYKCKECGYNFVIGDARTNEKIVALKALCVLPYSLEKASYNMMGKLFGRNRSLIYRWIRDAGLNMDEPVIGGEITQIEFDEMWHFILSKKRNFGLSKPLTVAAGELIIREGLLAARRSFPRVRSWSTCPFGFGAL